MSDNTGNDLGRTWGNKLKGAWNTVEGAGDSIRGGAMDFVDSATGTGGHHAETDIGKQKTQAGLSEVRSDGYTPQAGTQGTAGTTARTGPGPALPPRNAATSGATSTGTTQTGAAPGNGIGQ